jgi:hypothetical protein
MIFSGFSGPVIIDHSDIPPIPASGVRGIKMVVINYIAAFLGKSFTVS